MATGRSVEGELTGSAAVRRPADDCFSGNDAVDDIAEKPPNFADQEGGPTSTCSSNEQAAEDDGSKQVAMSASDRFTARFVESYIERAASINFDVEGPRPPFEAFLRSDLCQRLLKAGWGTHVPYEKPFGISWEDYSKVFDGNGYHISTGKKPGWENNASFAATVEHTPPPPVRERSFEHWACVNFSCMDAKETLRFLSDLTNTCLDFGMDFKLAPTIFLNLNCAGTVSSDIGNTLRNVHRLIAEHGIMGKQIGLLIVILPDIRVCDEKVEDMCEGLEVVYECCLPEHARMPSKQYLKTVACLINAKVADRKYYESWIMGEVGYSEESSDDEGMGEHGNSKESSDEEMGEDGDSQKLSGSEGSGQLDGPQEMREDNGPEAANSAEEMQGYIMSAGSTDPQPPFPCPDESEVLGTKVTYKIPRSMHCDDYSDLFDTNGNKPSKSKRAEDKSLVSAGDGDFIEHRADKSTDVFTAHSEKKPETRHIKRKLIEKAQLPESFITYVDLQVDRGIVKYWACVNFSCMVDMQLFRFSCRLANMCKAIGMHFSSQPIKTSLVKYAIPDDIANTLWTVHNSILELFTELGMKGEELGLLLVILPGDRDFDAKIKEACKNLGVVYQCCLPHDAIKASKLYLKKTARQIKTKVVTRETAIPFVSEAPTIIFGAGILPGEGSESIASVVASLDWPKVGNYSALVSCQPPNEVIIKDLFKEQGGMVSELMFAFRKKINRRADRIIFFRFAHPGQVIEGQLSHICLQEINAIKQGCASSEGGYVPPVTFVVVSEGHHMSPNPGYEIGVQEDSSNPTKIDFCCNHGDEGPSRYRVILDENNLTAHELQSIIIKLCVLRDRESYPNISQVTPVHCAGLAALNKQREIGLEL